MRFAMGCVNGLLLSGALVLLAILLVGMAARGLQ